MYYLYLYFYEFFSIKLLFNVVLFILYLIVLYFYLIIVIIIILIPIFISVFFLFFIKLFLIRCAQYCHSSELLKWSSDACCSCVLQLVCSVLSCLTLLTRSCPCWTKRREAQPLKCSRSWDLKVRLFLSVHCVLQFFLLVQPGVCFPYNAITRFLTTVVRCIVDENIVANLSFNHVG